MTNRTENKSGLPAEIARRRTFAIISHPDAGKTTLTEKFLLFGGAIQMAGQVRAKGEARRTRSDFMQMEKDRGISVSASAMSFDYKHFRYNLVDTPGHSDFSEDTYRTLTAVDAAVMLLWKAPMRGAGRGFINVFLWVVWVWVWVRKGGIKRRGVHGANNKRLRGSQFREGGGEESMLLKKCGGRRDF